MYAVLGITGMIAFAYRLLDFGMRLSRLRTVSAISSKRKVLTWSLLTPASVFMKLSHLALSQGFAILLMLAMIRCSSRTFPHSAEAY